MCELCGGGPNTMHLGRCPNGPFGYRVDPNGLYTQNTGLGFEDHHTGHIHIAYGPPSFDKDKAYKILLKIKAREYKFKHDIIEQETIDSNKQLKNIKNTHFGIDRCTCDPIAPGIGYKSLKVGDIHNNEFIGVNMAGAMESGQSNVCFNELDYQININKY